jgi:hypothetical protein
MVAPGDRQGGVPWALIACFVVGLLLCAFFLAQATLFALALVMVPSQVKLDLGPSCAAWEVLGLILKVALRPLAPLWPPLFGVPLR